MEERTNEIRPAVLDIDDIVAMAPRLGRHRRLVKWVMHLLSIDRVNDTHARLCDRPGVAFTTALLDDLGISLNVAGREKLEKIAAEGAFITVSNHPLGALDGVALINLVGSIRPDYKVMVNMILNHITALRPCFIAVDPFASADPKKKAISMQGIKTAIRMVREGHPVGFFPAGAMSVMDNHGRLMDRQWQPTILRLISQLKVPVVPIYFHDSNSWWFNLLGRISWQLRTLRLPAEVFRKRKSLNISVGDPISADEIAAHSESLEALGEFLKARTYALR